MQRKRVEHIENFAASEFHGHFDLMSGRLLAFLDLLRFQLGRPIEISKAAGAVARFNGKQSRSEHNVDFWRAVLAVDCFIAGIQTRDEVEMVVQKCTELGFTGIGIYPQWRNNKGEVQCGFHLGVRPSKKMGDPATWGFVNGEYVSIIKALDSMKQTNGAGA